nr:MAG TPA: hypothetical protein [Caudoviricetes sp.]
MCKIFSKWRGYQNLCEAYGGQRRRVSHTKTAVQTGY